MNYDYDYDYEPDYELNRHKTSDKVKWVLTLLAFILVGVMFAGILCGWFDKGEGEETPVVEDDGNEEAIQGTSDIVAVDSSGNLLRGNTVYAMPSSLTFVAAARSGEETIFSDSTSVTLTATITPANADNKAVTWESSNTSEVRVTPSASDPLTATVTLLGHLVDGVETVTCRSVDNPSAYATCQINYLIQGNDIEFEGEIVGGETELTFGETYTVTGEWNNTSPGSGTIMGETSNVRFSINLEGDFMQAVDGYLEGTGYQLSGYDASFDSSGVTETLFGSPYDCFYGGECDEEVFDHAFKMAMQDCDTHAILTIMGSYTYQGRSYKSGYVDIPITFSMEGIWIGVDGVDFGTGNVVFT